MRLWTDEIEEMRGEARAAVDATLPAIVELMGRGDDAADPATLDRDQQVAAARKAMEAIYLP